MQIPYLLEKFQDKKMNIKNIQIVHPISEYNSLAQVECVHEDLKSGYRKYEIFFINRNNQVVALFNNLFFNNLLSDFSLYNGRKF